MLVLLLCLVVFAWSQDALGQEAPAQQYLEFPNFTGGLNLSRIGQIGNNQALRLENFLLDEGEIRVRNGYGHICAPLGASGVNYLGVYRRSGVAGKLVAQSGNKLFIVQLDNNDTLWSDDEYTDKYFSTGTLSGGDSLSYYISTSDSTTKWESFRFSSVTLDSGGGTEYVIGVDYAVSDTLIKLESALPDWVAGWDYSFNTGLGTVVGAETFVDSFYIATTNGRMVYNDSILSGTILPLVRRAHASTYSRYAVAAYSGSAYRVDYLTKMNNVKLIDGTYYGGYAKISLRNVMADFTPLSGRTVSFSSVVHSSYGWNASDSTIDWVAVGGGCFYPDSTLNPTITFCQMEIDPTTALTVYADSLIFRKVLTNGGNGADTLKYPYTIVVDDSLFNGKDSTFFASGDWFVCHGTSIVDNNVWRMSPVIGGFMDADNRIYLAGTWLKNTQSATDTIFTNTPITFYRRVVQENSTNGYVAATFWSDRWCTVADSTSSQIDFSEDFEPMVSSGLLVQVNPDDGEPILWLKQMYGTLIIGKNSSIWKLTGVPGLDAFATLSKSIEGLSFVAPKSIVNYNNLMFGLGHDGFYVYDYNSMIKISQPIDNILKDSINWERADQVVGEYFDNHFWWSYPSRGSIVNDKTICYNPQLKAWSTATMDFSSVLVDRAVNDSVRVYIGAPDTGKVYLYGSDNDDDGTTITANLSTGWFNMGTDWHDKIVNRGLLTNHRRSSTSLSLSLTCVREEGTSQTVARTFDSAQGNYRGLSRAYFNTDQLRGTQYQLNITATTADSLRIGNVGLEYQVESVGY